MQATIEFTDIDIQHPEWDGSSYNWDPDIDTEITRTLDGESTPGTMVREEALKYVQQRFGCIYRKLPEEFQRDTEIAYVAACQSGGHTLKDAHQEIRDSFGPDFYIAAIRNGVRPWILKYITRTDVRESPEIADEISKIEQHERQELEAIINRDKAK